MANQQLAAEAARLMLHHLGINCAGEMADTPRRMAAALAELTGGMRDGLDPAGILARQFAAPSETPQLVAVDEIAFTSLCEHHVLPFTGTAKVAYLPQPGAKVVGVSKLARLVQHLSGRPQMQERLGDQVVEALTKHLDVQGAACLLRGEHTCMTLRGPRATGAGMITSHLRGVFFDGPLRAEFLGLR